MGVQQGRDSFGEYREFLVSLGEDNTGTRSRLMWNLSLAIMEDLTEKERQTLEMYYVQEIKMKDIADIHGVNPSTVSRNLKRARDKLRRILRYGARELLEEEKKYDGQS